ncbi:MAG TPA: GAF domain-containing protein, partial [Thermoanaerobaculia bacterium]|nr:GAF domain-containing protein [Thermoanaerobaculia bacterium]
MGERLQTDVRVNGGSSDAEYLLERQRHILELMATGAPLQQTLEALVRLVERSSSDGVLASILVVDAEGKRLGHGAAPSLPAAYNRAIDGTEIGPNVGSCGTAAHQKRIVVVADIARDPLWRDFRDLALEHGLRACWSTPIISTSGEVIGTFANYYREVRDPSPTDRSLVDLVTRTAAVAIEQHRHQQRLARQMNELRRVCELTEVLGRAGALEQMYDAALDALQDLLRADRAAVLLFDDDGVMRFKGWRGLSDAYRGAVEGHSPWRRGETSPRPVFISDVTSDASLAAYRSLFAVEGIRSILFVPLVERQRLVGKLVVYFDRQRDLAEGEMRIAETIGRHVAVAVERRRREGKLDATNAILSAIFDGTTDAVFVKGRDGRYLMANESAARIAAFPVAEMAGKTARDIFSPETAERIAAHDEIVMSSNQTYMFEEATDVHGVKRTFLSTKSPYRDSAGNVIGLIGIARDISERKKGEEELRRRAAQQAGVAELSLHALSTSDLQKLFGRAVEIVPGLLGVDFSALIELLPDQRQMRVCAAGGWSDILGIIFPAEPGTLAGYTLSTRGAVVVEEWNRETRFACHPLFERFGIRSGISVIVHGHDHPFGVLAAHARTPRSYSSDDIHFLQSIANILGIAIERRLSADASRRSEERFRSLVNATAQVVWTAAADGTISDVPEWRSLTGLSPSELHGEGWLRAIHPGQRERVRRAWAAAVESRAVFDSECLVRVADGSHRYFAVRGVPVIRADGSVREWVGTWTDIDERRRASEALELLAEAGAVVTASLDLGEMLRDLGRFFVTRLADTFVIALSAGSRGIDSFEAAASNPADMEMLREAGAARLSERLAEGVVPELLTGAKARELLPVRGAASAMLLPLAARSHLLGLMLLGSSDPQRFGARDLAIGEELATRIALAIDNAMLYREASAANRAKDEFLATLSHELRTPMTAILGWTRMLQLANTDRATYQTALEAIEQSTRVQAQIIEDILDVSRVITGKMTLDARAIELVPVIRRAVGAVKPAARAKSIHLRLTLSRARRAVSGDPNRLQQVVWNLVSNAIKFTPSGGTVEISLSYSNGNAEITVADTGQGIDPALLPHVFERFRQGDSSSTRAHGGLGLGLAIVRHLVDLHGGSVSAASEGVGKGATFVVRLPIVAAAVVGSPDPRHVASRERLPLLRRTRILIIDDEEQTRTFLSTFLERCGAEVRTGASAEEGLASLSGWTPDVVVSDLAMPHEDGYAFLERLRLTVSDRARPIPAIALTAYGRPEDRERALAAGFVRFV